MAFDAEPGGDPRNPVCPKCGLEIAHSHTRTLIHAPDRMSAVLWHAECARPLWDTLTPVLERLRWP